MTVMARHGHTWSSIGALWLVALPLALALTSCHPQPAEWAELGAQQNRKESRPSSHSGLHVIPIPQSHPELVELKANDVIKIMKSVGCTNDQIIEVGTDLHDALAQMGAARLMTGKTTLAIMQVRGKQVLIQTSRGTLAYNPARGQVGLPDVLLDRPM